MEWLREHPEVRTIRVAAADLNGVARGKRIPARFAEKLLADGTKFPYSVLNMDIWGEDIEDSPLVFEAGDPDGLLLPTTGPDGPPTWHRPPERTSMRQIHADDVRRVLPPSRTPTSRTRLAP